MALSFRRFPSLRRPTWSLDASQSAVFHWNISLSPATMLYSSADRQVVRVTTKELHSLTRSPYFNEPEGGRVLCLCFGGYQWNVLEQDQDPVPLLLPCVGLPDDQAWRSSQLFVLEVTRSLGLLPSHQCFNNSLPFFIRRRGNYGC